ncbi:checkpoint serine/threonine-protein kinase, partial [Cryptococcus neoformans A1-35-8]
IDNCLVRIADLPNSSWSAAYSRAGSDGWSQQGLRLIDFGRAIDLSLFPRGTEQTFQVSHTVDDKDCTEMRQGKPWSYQTDYFGLAGVAYCMLFGKYMKTIISEGKVKIDQPLKRYWQPQLWQPLFDTLLNPGHSLPITNQLTTIREELEGWLEDNCQKGGKSLKSLLRKIELAATTGKKM